MTANLIATGYIIQDKQGTAIFGTGATVDEAWAQVVTEAGPFFDAYGNAKADEAAFTEDFKTFPATAALIAKVEAEGGAIAWALVDGICCTCDEAEADDEA